MAGFGDPKDEFWIGKWQEFVFFFFKKKKRSPKDQQPLRSLCLVGRVFVDGNMLCVKEDRDSVLRGTLKLPDPAVAVHRCHQTYQTNARWCSVGSQELT